MQPLNLPPLVFVGAGRLALALCLALRRRGVAVHAVASRQPATAEALVRQLAQHAPAALPLPRVCHADEAVAEAGLVFLTVPDDRITTVASSLPWRADQAVVHCSGATEIGALEVAARAGAQVGGFHPLQIFSDPLLAAGRLAGCSVALEGPPALLTLLGQLATLLGLHGLRLPAGARARYHAAAGYAASSLLPLLQEAVALWASFGQDEAACLRALLPLAHGTLEAAQARGVAGAMSGPISRGDAAVLQRQQAALAGLGEGHVALFRELGLRQLALARQAGRLSDGQWQNLHNALTGPAMPDGPDGPASD